MYGQKSSDLKTLLSFDKKFTDWVANHANENRRKTQTKDELRLRFYMADKVNIDEKALATSLLTPVDQSKTIKYVLATNEAIADTLIDLMR